MKRARKAGGGGRLTHLDARGDARMVDVGEKGITRRRAIAEAVVSLSPATRRVIASGRLPKGDLFPVVRLAAIQGAKEAARLVPLAHPIRLSHVAARVEAVRGGYRVTVEVAAEEKTGVEIEAIAGASLGAIALYDMVKALERGAVIGPIRLLLKEGGKSGRFRRRE